MRSLLHRVFHNLLKNVESRNSVLYYFSAILKNNDKRSQFHVDEKALARDGFMLNVLTVLQKLSVKIKLERVDPMYPFHWESKVVIVKDTKLRFNEAEYKEWIKRFGMALLCCTASACQSAGVLHCFACHFR